MPGDAFILKIQRECHAKCARKVLGTFRETGTGTFFPRFVIGGIFPREMTFFSRALHEHSLQLQYIILPYLFLEADKEVHYCKEKENIIKSEKREFIALQSQ